MADKKELPLAMARVLVEYTDEDHWLSTKELTKILEDEAVPKPENFNLQDYEIFIGIEKKYRPQEHDHSSSGPIYNLYDKEDSDSYYDYYRSDNRLVYELNEALSERLKVFFVAAKEEEKLEYNIFKSINSDIFNEFERERDNVIEITKSEIKEIKKQILDLEKRKDWLESE